MSVNWWKCARAGLWIAPLLLNWRMCAHYTPVGIESPGMELWHLEALQEPQVIVVDGEVKSQCPR